MKLDRSAQLYQEARLYIAGGVNSPARSWSAVGGEPLFLTRGRGSRIWDADNNEFIDYVCSWGALILGHAHPQVIAAIKEAAEKGTSFGAPTEVETELARMVVDALPSIELVRFVSSGTEAAMSALRLARAYTGRSKVIKFAGCYHGHADAFLVQAGSGAAAHGVPNSAGVTPSYAQDTLVAEYNDLDSVGALFRTYPEKIACIIVEPIAANMGVVPPQPGFLMGLQDAASRYGALLIFDEVISGFRVAYGGAQTLYGVTPDITCLGKIIGGGMPVGAYGARREIMAKVSPLGPMYQAGTLSGNPVAMAAGVATLRLLQRPGVYRDLEAKSKKLAQGLEAAFAGAGVTVQINRVGSLLTPFFSRREVIGWESVSRSNKALYGQFFHRMLEQGVYMPPSPFEACFVSLAHSDEDLEATAAAAEKAARARR